MEVATVGINLDARNYLNNSKKVVGSTKKMGNAVHRQTGRMKKSFGGLVSSMSPLRAGLSALVTGVSFGAVIRNASNFEKKMKEVSTLLSDTSGIDALSEGMDGLALKFGNAPVEQAGALYDVISAGASSAAEAMDILDAANSLALGGVTDIGTATDGLTSILNAYGDKVKDATDVSDSMFVAMKAGKTTIGELSAAIGQVAPLAESAGVTLQELLAATAALTKGGISTRIAMTGMRAILAAIVKPTSEAVTVSKELGLEFNATAIEAKGFAGFMEEVVEKTQGSTDKLALLFGGVEALVPVLRLAGAGAADMAQVLEDMEKRGGQTAIAVAKMKESFDFKLGQFTSSVSVLAKDLGNLLLPAITSLVQAMTGGIQAIRDWGAELALLAKIVALGGVLYLGLKAQPAIYKAIVTWQTLAAASTFSFSGALFAMSTQLARFKLILFAITPQLTLFSGVLGTIVSLVAGIQIGKYLSEEFSTVRIAGLYMVESLLVAWEHLKTGWENIKSAITFNFDEFDANATKMAKNIAEIRESFGILVDEEFSPTKPKTDSGVPVPEPDPKPKPPPSPPTPDTSAADLQKRVNDLLAEYAKAAALGGHATEEMTMRYELLHGELKNVNDASREQLLIAAKTADQNEMIISLTDSMRDMVDQTEKMNVTTAEQAALIEVTTGKYADMDDSLSHLKDQYVATARAMDDARFEREARELEKALIPAERYADAIAHINELRDRGKLSAEAYSEAIYNEQLRSNEAARSMRDSFSGFFKDVIKGTESVGEAFGNMIIGFGEKMTDAAMDQLADDFMKTFFPTIGPQGTNTLGIEGLLGGGASSTPPINGSPTPVTVVGDTATAQLADQLENIMPESMDVMIKSADKPIPVSIVSGGCCNATESIAKEIKNISQGARSSGNYSIDRSPQDLDALGEADARITEDLTSALENSSGDFFDEFENGAEKSWEEVNQSFDVVASNMDQGMTDVIHNLDNKVSQINSGGGSGGFFGSLTKTFLDIIPKNAHGADFVVPGYARSGDFRVGGSGGIDSQLVAFKATPNERVTVTRPQDSNMREGSTIIVNVTASKEVTQKTARQVGVDIGSQISRARRGI